MNKVLLLLTFYRKIYLRMLPGRLTFLCS